MENDLATLVGLTAKYRFGKSLGKESDNYGRKKLPATINVEEDKISSLHVSLIGESKIICILTQ
jgi:hypothetical protein